MSINYAITISDAIKHERVCLLFTETLGPLTIESVGVSLQIGAHIADSPFEGIAELWKGQSCLVKQPLTVWTWVIIIMVIKRRDGGSLQSILTHTPNVH